MENRLAFGLTRPACRSLPTFPASQSMRMFRNDRFPRDSPHQNPGRSGKFAGAVIKWHRLADIQDMGPTMTTDSGDLDDLLQRVQRGDEQALVALFTRYRDRLRRMVRLRLDRRLQGRIDPSDVLQEAYLDVARRAGEYAANPRSPSSSGCA